MISVYNAFCALVSLATQAPPQAKAAGAALLGKAVHVVMTREENKSDVTVILSKEKHDALNQTVVDLTKQNADLREQLDTQSFRWKAAFAACLPSVALATMLVMRTLTNCDERGA